MAGTFSEFIAQISNIVRHRRHSRFDDHHLELSSAICAAAEMYLKAPTLMYVFIMIALRSLRFEPGYVLIAEGAAAFGWMILVLYAIVSGDQSMVTRRLCHLCDLTFRVDRCGSRQDCLDLDRYRYSCLCLSRSRKLLYRAASEQQAAADLSRFSHPKWPAVFGITTKTYYREPRKFEKLPFCLLIFAASRAYARICSQLM